jgi:type IV pilus assembly protein PilM
MVSNTVSIYIDDVCVRVMVARGKRINRVAELKLDKSLAEIDSKEKEIELGKKIKYLLKFNKIPRRKIILGISGLHCLTRPVALPELPKAMIGEAVLREARRVLPMPLEQLYLSSQVLSVNGGRTNVYLAALPRQMADMVIRVMNYAGCKPFLMDIKPLALARLSPEPTAIIMDVQANEFDIVMMVDGIPQPVRTITYPHEALSFPDKYGYIKEELKRTLDFVRTKQEENKITPDTTMYISGELAEHPELFGELSAEFKIKTAKLALPMKYVKNLEPAPYLVNAGLSLKEMVRETHALKPNFSTLPAPYQPKKISLSKIMAVPAAICALGVLALMTIAVRDAGADLRIAQTQLDTANSLIQKKQAQKVENNKIVTTLEQQKVQVDANYETYAAAYKKLMTTGNNMNTDVDCAVNSVHDGISIESMVATASFVSVSGTANTEEDVFKYVRDLTSTERFQELTISAIERVETNSIDENGEEIVTVSYKYSVNCAIKDGR